MKKQEVVRQMAQEEGGEVKMAMMSAVAIMTNGDAIAGADSDHSSD